MSVSYIPQETYAVCTNQMSATPQKLIASRGKVTVFHNGKPLLTTEDKNLEVQFPCKSPINTAATFLAAGAGLLIGAILLSNPIGWVVAGCLAIAVGIAYTVKSVTHQCTSPMKMSSWVLYHPTTKFDGYNAITQMSMLSCTNGGILKPFLNYSLACSVAKEIRNTNYTEVSINVVVSFFLGRFLPASFAGKSFLKAGAYFIGTNVVGLGVTWSIQYTQREYMRSDSSFSNNIVYQEMNNELDENAFLQPIDDPSDLNDLDGLSNFKTAIKEGKISTQNHTTNQKLDRFSNMTTNQLKESAEFKQFLKDVNKGKYGEGLKKSMVNIFGKMKPNVSAVGKGMNYTAENFKSSLKNMAKSGGLGSLFFLPFLSTYFSENMRKYFAEMAVKDVVKGINVIAQRPI